MGTDLQEGGTIGEKAVPILFIFGIFFLNMLSRLGLGPLMPAIEAELGLRHVQAGSLFLPVSVGYGGGLFVSIFLSARVSHHRLIFVSALAVGAALLFISRIQGLFLLYFALFCLGLTGGLYLPSGVAMLTFLVRRRDWGKVLSIHQMAPNLAYICGPFAAALIADRMSWRFAMTAYGPASLAAAVAFRTLGPAEGFRGAVPRIELFKRLAETPAVWIMIVLFSLALGINQGLFSIIALYLTAERNLTMESANRLLAISRTVAFAMPLLTGWAADRYGLKRFCF